LHIHFWVSLRIAGGQVYISATLEERLNPNSCRSRSLANNQLSQRLGGIVAQRTLQWERSVTMPSPIGVHGMIDQVREHMEVIGADGVHVGTVDKVEGGRIKLTKQDSGEGSHKGHHHFISGGLVAGVEGDKVRLSANGDVAVTFEEEV